MHYAGYMIKAGHVAIIATAVTTGNVPDNQVEVAKKIVAERFATSNIYFAVDSLVSGAVKQLQGVIGSVENMLSDIPGIKEVGSVAKLFISIALGYIDECCMGYTFIKKDQNAFKSAADGVVIYAQNWQKLLKDAAVTTGLVIASLIGVTLVVFLIFGLLFKVLHWSGLVAFILSALVAYSIKYAFIDSWILVKMMVSYMEVAPSTTITFDLYGKLCDLSSKFKELFDKGQYDQPVSTGAVASEVAVTLEPGIQTVPASNTKQAFCGQCGKKNPVGTKFCGGCGTKLL
jgi:hypothetical protein